MSAVIIPVVSWLAVVGMLAAYASGRRKLYDRANVVLFVPVCLPALLAGAYSSAAISIAFGVLGAVNLVRNRRTR